MKMAFYDDKKFLLSHIRHSFITCDDTGMCEMVMLNELIQNISNDDPNKNFLNSIEVETKSELLEAAQSFDIMSDFELIGAHRRRSNTAQRLEKLNREKKNQAKVKVITWKKNPQTLTESELAELFPKRELNKQISSKKCIKSLLSMQLERCPTVPSNPFNEFARFDGRVTEGTPTKRLIIYLTMLPPETRSHPIEVVTSCNARVHDLIGLICWQYTMEGKEPKLKPNVKHYALKIAEENGEIDPDFPSLNPKEPVAKFGFPVLALVEKEEDSSSGICVTIHIDEVFSKIPVPNLQTTLQEILELTVKKRRASLHKGVCYKLEKKNEPGVTLDLKSTLSELNTLEFILVSEFELETELNDWKIPDMLAMEAPLYKSYNVVALNHYGKTAEVQLGISGEKLEVTPEPQKGNIRLFSWHPKASTCNVEDIVMYELLPYKDKNGRSTFRVTYHNGNDYKTWAFSAETKIANEICKKLDYVMKMRTSNVRDEYLNTRGQNKHKPRFLNLSFF